MMKIELTREQLLHPLQQVMGVIERRQTLPILANVLIECEPEKLRLTGSDLEVQLVSHEELPLHVEGAWTVPARKLLDICRLLPDNTSLLLQVDDEHVTLIADKSRFVLSTLPATDYPAFDVSTSEIEIILSGAQLKRALEKTHFSMAQQDVRFYLNGLMLEVDQNTFRTVSSDGHRLSIYSDTLPIATDITRQIIIPRKGVMELSRLLSGDSSEIKLTLSSNAISISQQGYQFSAKLIDGKFPDYRKVVPRDLTRVVEVSRELLKSALTRVSILFSEKFKGVRFEIAPGRLLLSAQNPEHEHAEEEVAIDYEGDEFSLGFNAAYILDAISNIDSSLVRMSFTDANSSCLIEDIENQQYKFIIMPMRL